MTKLLFIFILSFSILSGQTKIISTSDNLKNLFIKSTSGPDTISIQKSFFDAFPATFKDLNEIYGYSSDSDWSNFKKGPLYDVSFEHINLFYRLTSIQTKEFYKKIINISIGGHWDADAINRFQHGLREKVFANPKLTFDLLKDKSNNDIKSFWFFFYSGIHHTYEKIPSKLNSLNTYDNRIYGLMQKGLDEALKQSGH